MEPVIDPTLVGARLRRWRDELNLSGADVAGKVAGDAGQDFTWTELRGLELGEQLPDARTTEWLVAALGRTTADLLGPETAAELEAAAAVENPDGTDDRPPEIRARSPYRPGRLHAPTADPDWEVQPGEEIERSALQARYGGGRQGGIAPCKDSRNVLVFSDPTAGPGEGVHDRWNDARTVFSYCGDGKNGDQQFVRGNRAIRDHVEDRKALRVFEGSKGVVRYAGEFVVDPDHRYDWVTEASADGPERRLIVFRLLPR